MSFFDEADSVDLTGCIHVASQTTNAVKIVSDVTLRDRIAMRAMQGMLSRDNYILEEESLARLSYKFADAMLKARDVPARVPHAVVAPAPDYPITTTRGHYDS